MNIALNLTSILLLILSPRQDNKVIYRFTGAKSGVESSIKLSNDGRKLVCINQSLPELYAIAFFEGNRIESKRSLFSESVGDVYDKKYCYELEVSEKLKMSIYKIMQKNLRDKFPNLTASLVKVGGKKYLKIEKKEGSIITTID